MTQSDSGNLSVERNRQLARLRATIHRLLDQTSHDFRTPLTVIKEFATLMHDGLVGPVNPRQSKYLEIINDRADELTAMIQNVLDAGKLELGELRLWRRPTDVGEAVAGMKIALARKAAIKNVPFRVAIEPDLPTVHADQDQLNHILANVATGVLDAFERPESVRLWARSEAGQDEVRIGLSVRGGRIEPHRLNHIRRALDPARPPDLGNTKGSALRLTLARCMVDSHFGQTHFEHGPDGQADFSMTLPVSEPLRLLNRYLHHLALRRPERRTVGLMTATIHARARSVVANVIDEFLQHWVDVDDLVVQVEKHRWGLLVLGDEPYAEDIRGKIDSAWSETRDNRPGGLLPRLDLTTLGYWDWTTDADGLVDRFRTEMAPDTGYASSRRTISPRWAATESATNSPS